MMLATSKNGDQHTQTPRLLNQIANVIMQQTYGDDAKELIHSARDKRRKRYEKK